MSITEVIEAVRSTHRRSLDNGTLEIRSIVTAAFSPDLLPRQAYALDWGSRRPEKGWPDGPGPRHDPEVVRRYGVAAAGALRWAEQGTVRDLLGAGLSEYLVSEELRKVDTYDYDVESGLDATNIPPDILSVVIYTLRHDA